jgi:hypothetical protein
MIQVLRSTVRSEALCRIGFARTARGGERDACSRLKVIRAVIVGNGKKSWTTAKRRDRSKKDTRISKVPRETSLFGLLGRMAEPSLSADANLNRLRAGHPVI